ncbi:MAG TPA: S8 family serine peptidase, partial [Steroidobacteraceae bacterium]|nr:S8 family serine peptidase [Steroidobacteraceae bacterium]
MPTLQRMAVAITAMLATVLSIGPADAQQASGSRFTPLSRTGPITAQPLSMLAQERVQVVVTMNTESVAEVRARTPGHVISKQDHDAIHAAIAQQHAALEPAIASRGGKVLTHFADAMNGMKVEIARGEIAGLSALPGVVQVVGVPKYKISNTVSVPFIGAPAVWQGVPGFRGEHVKIAIIDTGVDYTHANFGGPGTVAAFNAAFAASTAPADPTLFGPNAPKVKGGTDLVGDNYDAAAPAGSPKLIPVPDPNPLDCNGHGSHVSGTAAGFGVTNDGATYHGPYNEAAYAAGFGIGPGVAPLADLYMVRVFGCTGSTNVVSEAIDWAVHNDMDVISMSLGAPYGAATSSDAIASDNASKAGIIVVAAAGNNGPGPYVTSDPASASRGISVAATNARPFLANGVHITFTGGGGANGVEADSVKLPSGSVPALVLKSGTALSLGCNATDYPAGGAPGALVIVSRGSCTFDTKWTNAAAAGAAAIGVVNNAAGFFNPLLTNPTIPFIELLKSDTPVFVGEPSPVNATVAFANVPDVTFRLAASFSSGGPRSGDGALKPNVTAPGVNVFSTSIGTGTGGQFDSGTSMATPHVAGVAALAIQAHQDWKEPGVRAAVVQTGSPSALLDYSPRIEGSGLVQAVGATATNVTAHADGDEGRLGLLSFGVAELTRDFRDDREIVIRDHSRFPATFTATATSAAGVPHSVQLSSSSVSVRGHDETHLRMTLSVPAATAGATHDAAFNVLFEDASGVITLTPEGSTNNGVSLNLPYYMVTRARSDVDAQLRGDENLSVRLNNRGAISGNADFYAWGLKNPKSGTISEAFEPRAVGVQTNPISPTDSILVFAVNT